MRIIPSLVENTAEDLFARIAFLSPYYKQFQVDIEDGIFIQNKTLSMDDFSTHIQTHFSSLSSALIYDFHLMTLDYERAIATIGGLKTQIHIDTVLIHTKLHPNYAYLQKKFSPFRIGLVINPEEDVSLIAAEYNLKDVPLMQLMTVHPGRQGQPFIKEVLKKIEQVKKAGFIGEIYIDGAVNETTIPFMQHLPHLPDVLCPGSYLAHAPASDLKRRVTYLQGINRSVKSG